MGNKYGFGIVVVGGRPTQELIGPGQFQVTRGNQFLFDLVDLCDATEVKANVQGESMLLVDHRPDLWRITRKYVIYQMFQILVGLWRYWFHKKSQNGDNYSNFTTQNTQSIYGIQEKYNNHGKLGLGLQVVVSFQEFNICLLSEQNTILNSTVLNYIPARHGWQRPVFKEIIYFL